MNKKEFNRVIKSITVVEDGKKRLSLDVLQGLSNEVKNQMIQVIVSARHPVLVDLINKDTDISWLHSMGYLYPKKGGEYEFVTHGG